MILVLTGPTASGKSKIAISLARKLNGVVINADAFQVYQELNIATAKPTPAERAMVPHLLFDFVPLDHDYSVAEYQLDLRRTLQEVEKEGKVAIIAGGTGLYLRAGLYDYSFEEEPTKVDMSSYDSLSDQELYDKLVDIDPDAAKAIHPNNRIRVRRAIEIYLTTGKKKSDIEKEQRHEPLFDVRFFALEKERAPLYQRVEQRVEEMFEEGLVEEDLALIQKYGRTPHAFQAIGVKELLPYLDGAKSLEECKEDIKLATRHYVKRQETFFRHQFPVIWVKDEQDILNALSESK